MRIALVTHQFFPAYYTGVERLTLNLAAQLRRMGEEPVVLTSAQHSSGSARPYVHEGLRVRPVDVGRIDVARPWLQEPELAQTIARVLAEESADVVHVMHPMRLPQAFRAADLLGLPAVAHVADFGYLCARTTMIRVDGSICTDAADGACCESVCRIPAGVERVRRGRETLAHAAAVVCPCRFTIDLHAAQGFDPGNWHHVPWGTDYALHPERLPAPGGDELVLGFLGTLLRHKGLHVVLEAMRLLPGRPLRLLAWGGSFHEGDYERSLRRLAEGDPRVEFLGSYGHDELDTLLRRLDAVVIPSVWHENLPTTGLNAVAAGVPLLVSDVGGLRELIDDYRCGRSFRVGDAAALAQLLDDVLADRAELDRMRDTMAYPPSLEEEAWLVSRLYRESAAPAP